MKVGINARTFSVDSPGGAIQTAKKIAHRLINDRDIDVLLFGHSSIESEFGSDVLCSRYTPINSQSYGVFWERTILPWLAKKHDVDTLLCPNGNAPISNQPFRVVMYIHDVNAQKGLSSRFHRVYRKLAIPSAARKAESIVTVSNFSAKEIQNHLGVGESKIDVVYNGVDEYFLNTDSGDSVDLPAKYILFVGSLNPRKNIEGVIKSYRRFKRQYGFDHKLVIIGPQNKSVFRSVDVEEGNDLIFPGFLTKSELKYAYRKADLFTFPSFYEGFGLPPLEAMACGTPVVASNIPVHRETMGDSAYFVDPEDIDALSSAYKTILQDTPTRDALISKGKEIVQEYTWDSTIARLKDCL